jgi:putative ABC transport system substrate-binding protein
VFLCLLKAKVSYREKPLLKILTIREDLIMKRLLSVVLTIFVMVMAMMTLAASSKSESGNTPKTSDAKKKIGIVQIVEHPSLNTIRENIIQEIAAKGFKDG